MKKYMLILRGLPGCGKTTYAKKLVKYWERLTKTRAAVCSADDFFLQFGIYDFNPKLLQNAHSACKQSAKLFMANEEFGLVIIDNTNSQSWEYEPYLKMAQESGCIAKTKIIGKIDTISARAYATRGLHSVSTTTYDRMITRWEK